MESSKVQASARFELVTNLKTAKARGLADDALFAANIRS
jgi:hypothetical protein